MELRRLTEDEERLLIALLRKASLPSDFTSYINNLWVSPMNDGRMGSLKIFPAGDTERSRKFSRQCAEIQFTDLDGIIVLASLNLDESDNLYELDIWKTDFSPLVRIPKILE